MIEFFRSLIDLAGQHPELAVVIAFLTAMLEAVLVVGLFIPSTVVLVGLGGLMGLGKLPFWPIFAATTAGAIAGDAISYWLGRVYRQRLLTVWPFDRYRGVIEAGERFFRSHGGKSVVLGRFVPGVKSVVPAVAGMVGMGSVRFGVLNAGSAVIWASAHLLPGYFAGTALSIAGTISKRLVVVLVALGVSALLVVWIARIGLRLGFRALPRAQASVVRWASTQPAPHGPALLRLVSPDHEDFRLLALLLGLFAATIMIGAKLIEDVVTGDAVIRLDVAVSAFLQSLRTGLGDQIMIGATMLGDTTVTAAVTAAAAAALTWQRRRRLALGVIVAVLGSVAFVFALKVLVQAPRPTELYSGTDAFSFPSGHATTSATLYGALALIALRGLPAPAGRWAASLLAALVALIAYSRVYLGAHWPSDVAEGLLFGTAAVSGLALVFRGYVIPQRVAGWTLGAGAAALLLVGGWHLDRGLAAAQAFYARPAPAAIALSVPWREGGWRELPAHRIDLSGEIEEPLVLQWRGDAASLEAALGALGWISPPDWSIGALNAFVLPRSAAARLAVVPNLHNGRREAVVAILPDGPDGMAGRHVLRAWAQDVSAGGAGPAPILLATVTRQIIERPLGLASLPFRDGSARCDAAELLGTLPGAQAVGTPQAGEDGACGGQTLLAEPAGGLAPR